MIAIAVHCLKHGYFTTHVWTYPAFSWFPLHNMEQNPRTRFSYGDYKLKIK